MTITPPQLTRQQQQEVVALTQWYVEKASEKLKLKIETISVLFDLTGRIAGMYRVKRSQRCIRYNPFIFARYYHDSLQNTVPHEVAHYVVDHIYGRKGIKPHGHQWQSIMALFDREPKVTGNYDLTGLPSRNYATFAYHCQCKTHQLTSIRHNRILRGQTQYSCNRCGYNLKPITDPAD